MEHLRSQYEELLVLQSMFDRSTELEFDEEDLNLLSDVENHQQSRDNFRFAIHCKDMEYEGSIPILRLEYPQKYPEESVRFEVYHPPLPRVWIEALREELKQVATNAVGKVVVLDLYQRMCSILEKAHADLSMKRQSKDLMRTNMIRHRDTRCQTMTRRGEPILGRRAIYFHHIAAESKRHALVNWAKELRLGGYSKIGWPGIVIVEGCEQNVQEYVRMVQRLRWKQMVVRGEQVELSSPDGAELYGGDDGDFNDADAILYRMRKFKQSFKELPMDGISTLAQICTDAGLKDLFLTTMKIYNVTPQMGIFDLQQINDGSDVGRNK
ncbi:unnamed protein product [Albugo candida]|uniref:RWD domain-containing protein n=1 Tax=Albugo candida TaxID=65357 RepID=A0A024G9T4_9STRA|nr:unnamed protein product [Albugo candida]|eukprot:CCI43389.1 unnamed protein product [Albugo candida]